MEVQNGRQRIRPFAAIWISSDRLKSQPFRPSKANADEGRVSIVTRHRSIISFDVRGQMKSIRPEGSDIDLQHGIHL